MGKYPRLTVDHNALRENIRMVTGWCRAAEIEVAGVIKGASGVSSIALDFESCGASYIASSRISQLKRAREEGVRLPLMMIRIPMLSELSEIVEICDYSLQSEFATLRELNDAAAAAGKVHNVILMADLGDLREGFFEREELLDVARHVEDRFMSLNLAGIGVNLGCYGSIIPTEEKMNELVSCAEDVEKAIGRRLDIISGGATSSLLPLFEERMPKRINNLRIGEMVLCGPNEGLLTSLGRSETGLLRGDVFTLEAEVIEVRTKPSHPIGKIGLDAFGQKRKYKDRGLRQRALLAIGRQDYADTDNLIPLLEGAEVIGASGDHTIVDIEDCSEIVRTGDIMKFHLSYGGVLFASSSEYININEVDRLYGIKI